MITEMANKNIGFSWLQKDKLVWHLVTSLQLPVSRQLYSLTVWFRKHLLSSQGWWKHLDMAHYAETLHKDRLTGGPTASSTSTFIFLIFPLALTA